MPSRSERISAAIAKRIVANTNKKFSTLHSEVLEAIRKEDQMLTENFAVPAPQEIVVTTKKVDEIDLLTGENSLTNAAPAVMPAQSGPRDVVPAPEGKL